MSAVCDIVLFFDYPRDHKVVDDLRLSPHSEDENTARFARIDTRAAGGDKVFTKGMALAAVNYADLEFILAEVEKAPWKAPEEVLLLVEPDQHVRSAVYGFAGARYFGCVDEPRKIIELVAAVPS